MATDFWHAKRVPNIVVLILAPLLGFTSIALISSGERRPVCDSGIFSDEWLNSPLLIIVWSVIALLRSSKANVDQRIVAVGIIAGLLVGGNYAMSLWCIPRIVVARQ